jgi:tryptophan synthase alpha chain
MSRLSDRFALLLSRGERALVCYVVAGDPSLERTVDVVLALDEAGVDAIELGIPFSDPLADGPSIQASAQRALAAGSSVARSLEVVRAIRERSSIPLVAMTYFNPILRYGVERFAREAARAGIDGVIQTDLTPEEAGEWVDAARANGLDSVFLVAPTSTDERIEIVSRLSTGFIYAVSRTGVTGARADIPEELPQLVARVKARTSAPVCVGFGVSRPEHVRRIGAFADGVVVGSALVDVIGRSGNSSGLAGAVRDFAADLKAATRSDVAK